MFYLVLKLRNILLTTMSVISFGGGGSFVATSSNVPLIIGGGGGGIASVTQMYSNADGIMAIQERRENLTPVLLPVVVGVVDRVGMGQPGQMIVIQVMYLTTHVKKGTQSLFERCDFTPSRQYN